MGNYLKGRANALPAAGYNFGLLIHWFQVLFCMPSSRRYSDRIPNSSFT